MLSLIEAGFTTAPALAPVSDTLYPGELVAVVGPNGAGKSTLLTLLSGFRGAEQGVVKLDGTDLGELSIAALSRRRSLVAQQEYPAFDWPVAQLVALGSQPGEALVIELLEGMDLLPLAQRSVLSLSGGERQRVMIARGVCQLLARPAADKHGAMLLLDEPTSALDIGHQQRLMRRLRHWAVHHQLAVVCVLHDLNLAATFADKVWLMHRGARIAHGRPEEVLSRKTVTRVYDVELAGAGHSSGVAPLSLAP